MADVMEANGNGVPHFADVADFVAEPGAEVQESVAQIVEEVKVEEEEDDVSQRSLYFVRIPKPFVDDSQVKKLQEKFQKDIAVVKEYNTKLQAKRAELNDLRTKLREARSLKDGVAPEFGDKFTLLTELRQKRDGYLKEIKEVRAIVKGLDVRSEDELDAKINELEAKIRSGEITIREERDTVKQIARLNAQREKVREFEVQRDTLAQNEEELTFIKRCIDELESEYNLIREEKVATDTIIKDWKAKLDAKQAEMKELEDLQQVVVDAKNRTLAELSEAREVVDATMKEYRENRKFSATIRDLVEQGQADQARAMVEEQVAEMMGKLTSDAQFRKEYTQLWASQRRFPVAEILPSSCVNAPADPQPKGKAGPKPPQPQGKKKAEAIIANLLESTRLELSERRQSSVAEEEPEPVMPLPKPSAKAAAAPEPKPLAAKPAADAPGLFNYKVDLPDLDNAYAEEFVPPVVKDSAPQLSEEELKKKIREEQKAKAREAEERKKRLEQKKKEALDKKKQQQAARKAAEAAAAAAGAVRVSEDIQPATDDSAVEVSAGEEEAAAPVEEKPVPRQRKGRLPSKQRPEPVSLPVKKKPKVGSGLWKQVEQHPALFSIAVIALIVLFVGWLVWINK